ncbi:TPA: ComEC family competence protein [Streptococcus pneumoniae]|nr:ComEC family competence protein [Streptococcus pneumoniae]HEU2241258.1 ComEC family competence protein [Streptococcus pneumoniae]
MLQWIKNFSIPLIYLSFLLLWLYYAIFSASYLALLGFVFLLVCLFIQFPWKSAGKVLIICGIFGFWFVFQNWQQSQASQNLADSVERVRILPDTIKVNGDSLSFRGKSNGRAFQVYYKLQSEEEKEAFQALTDLHEIGLEGKLSEPEGQRNFGGFNYQAYLKTQGIYQTLNIKKIQSLQKIGSWDIGENLSSLRRKAVVWIKTHFPDPMRNYMTGLLLGHLDTDFEEMNELYSSLGIIHLFALSGLFDLTFLPLLSILFVLSFLYPVIQLNFIFEWLEGIIRLVSQVTSRPLVFGQPNAWFLILLLISLALVYDLRKNIKKLTVLCLLITGLFLLTKHPLENEITMLDVGQGESIFLRDVTGKTILIDVGGKAESYKKIEKWQEKMTTSNAQRTLIPYLKSRGVAKIDQLILTNTDKEHVGDLLEVTKAFHVGEILVSKGSLKQKQFVVELQATQTKVRSMTVGENLPIFGSQLEVLSPRKMGDGGHDDTLVLYGKFLDKQFLFTGNLEEKGEKDLLKHYPDLKVNVLKASQHGNKKSSSPAFLEKLKPELTLISVGKSNRMKLPHQETLTRLEGINSKVYRTDQQGAIRFKGWNSWKIESVR